MKISKVFFAVIVTIIGVGLTYVVMAQAPVKSSAARAPAPAKQGVQMAPSAARPTLQSLLGDPAAKISVKVRDPKTGEITTQEHLTATLQLGRLLHLIMNDKEVRAAFFEDLSPSTRPVVANNLVSLFRSLTGLQVVGDLLDFENDLEILSGGGGAAAACTCSGGNSEYWTLDGSCQLSC